MRKNILLLVAIIFGVAATPNKDEALKFVRPKEKVISRQEIDLIVDEELDLMEEDNNLEVLDLESDYSIKPARKRGDVSVKPVFEMPEPDDPTVSDLLEKEKNYKLEFNIGL